MEMLEEHRCFEGWQQRWRHDSSTLNCPMTFSIFLPPPRDHTPPPVLYWLSGLTCNDENFTTKAGAQRVVTMALHSPQVHGMFEMPVDHLSANHVLAEHFRLRQVAGGRAAPRSTPAAARMLVTTTQPAKAAPAGTAPQAAPAATGEKVALL